MVRHVPHDHNVGFLKCQHASFLSCSWIRGECKRREFQTNTAIRQICWNKCWRETKQDMIAEEFLFPPAEDMVSVMMRWATQECHLHWTFWMILKNSNETLKKCTHFASQAHQDADSNVNWLVCITEDLLFCNIARIEQQLLSSIFLTATWQKK